MKTKLEVMKLISQIRESGINIDEWMHIHIFDDWISGDQEFINILFSTLAFKYLEPEKEFMGENDNE